MKLSSQIIIINNDIRKKLLVKKRLEKVLIEVNGCFLERKHIQHRTKQNNNCFFCNIQEFIIIEKSLNHKKTNSLKI